ncbi:hypothetical protein [Streptomyces sp. T028]|uniref:hypothetical protein n=1 Tax=Streptomyces sp. T028 TaxID=3394379 RepID=UPI003A836718
MTTRHEHHDSDDYSATALDSFWVERGDDGTTVVHSRNDDGTAVMSPRTDDDPTAVTPRADAGTTVPAPSGGATVPHGRVDGTVLRFGPGVTAPRGLTTGSVRGTRAVAVPDAPPAGRHRRLRRHALPALVLVAAVLFLLWRQHHTPGLSVRGVTAAAARPGTGCDATADVVGVVRTDGHAGELSYRWIRNDGTESDVLRATVAEGRRTVRLHLLWTFQGQGRYAAAAELRVLSPAARTARAAFAYDCP